MHLHPSPSYRTETSDGSSLDERFLASKGDMDYDEEPPPPPPEPPPPPPDYPGGGDGESLPKPEKNGR